MAEKKNVLKIDGAGARLLITLSCAVIIITALKLSAGFIIPLTIAFFLAMISAPVMFWLRRHGVHRYIAIGLTFFLNFIVVGLIVLLLKDLIAEFQSITGGYIIKLKKVLFSWIIHVEKNYLNENFFLFERLKVNNLKDFFFGFINFDAIINIVRDTTIIGTLIDFTKKLFIVLILMLFMLTEANTFSKKLINIYNANGPNLKQISKASKDVQRYLVLKTLISMLTGLFAWFVLFIFDQDFKLLWGLLAFALNFIPAIGSIIAAIPPIIVAFVDGLQGPNGMDISLFQGNLDFREIKMNLANPAGLLIGYLLINIAIGNFLEPMLLGRRFGLSTLVVILSVLFWGWIWGWVGMFLAVPLTMLLKVFLDNTRDLRWISIAMEKNYFKASRKVDKNKKL